MQPHLDIIEHAGDATLEWSDFLKRWEGEFVPPGGGIILVWMTQETFEKHLHWYFERQLITEPSQTQREEAIRILCKITYWKSCTGPDVHIRPFGRAAYTYRALATPSHQP